MMKMKKELGLLAFSLAFGATYYVDVNGHNTNTGTSLANPCQTIQLCPQQPNQGTRP